MQEFLIKKRRAHFYTWESFIQLFVQLTDIGIYAMKRILLFLIKLYRKYISPMKSTKCPYYPTCSQYGMEAIEKYGAIKGGALAAWRILRCNPLSKGGYDPVP